MLNGETEYLVGSVHIDCDL